MAGQDDKDTSREAELNRKAHAGDTTPRLNEAELKKIWPGAHNGTGDQTKEANWNKNDELQSYPITGVALSVKYVLEEALAQATNPHLSGTTTVNLETLKQHAMKAVETLVKKYPGVDAEVLGAIDKDIDRSRQDPPDPISITNIVPKSLEGAKKLLLTEMEKDHIPTSAGVPKSAQPLGTKKAQTPDH